MFNLIDNRRQVSLFEIENNELYKMRDIDFGDSESNSFIGETITMPNKWLRYHSSRLM